MTARPKRVARCAAFALVAMLASPASAKPEQEGRFIELFVASAEGRRLVGRVDLDAIPQQTRRGSDPQYQGVLRMRGIPLNLLWAAQSIPPNADLALLRFDDGLQIPVAFRDPLAVGKLDAFVVRASASAPDEALVAGRIEEARRPPTEEDLRPVTFHGNKVVVSDATLAPVLASVSHDLKPWLYADSLFAIDFVERAVWEAHLDAGPATQEGRKVFLGSCRFCHAVRGTGGALGWDFMDPILIYSDEWLRHFRTGEINDIPARTMLSTHVRFRAGIGGSRTMPALRGMRPAEVQALWTWLQALAAQPAK